nr:immunoglobulin heavy chain junction region [Macaca mulatta]
CARGYSGYSLAVTTESLNVW